MRESNGKGRESYPMIQIVYLHGSDKFHRICESLMIIIITGVWGWIRRKIRRDGGRKEGAVERERGGGEERERERKQKLHSRVPTVAWHQIFQISKRERYTDPHDLQPHLLWVPWDRSPSTALLETSQGHYFHANRSTCIIIVFPLQQPYV